MDGGVESPGPEKGTERSDTRGFPRIPVPKKIETVSPSVRTDTDEN